MEEKSVIIEVLVLQIVSITFLLTAVVYLIKQSRTNRYEKRIEAFSISNSDNNENSFFDKIYLIIWRVIKKIAKFLQKLTFISKYAKSYEKFILFEELELKSGYDYIAIKTLVSLLLSFLSLFTIMFFYLEFNINFFLIIIIGGFFIPDIYLNFQFNRKKKQVEEDLLKAIIIMNNAFKSGSNITQAVGIVRDELDGAISDEFKKIYIDINYGLGLDIVFNRFYDRVKLEDAKYITSSLSLLNKTGGNIVKVFSLIEKTFFDKKKLRNELNSMTASSIFVFRILIILPFVLVLTIYILNPSYFKPFFNNMIGILCFVVLILLYALYILVVNKLLKVKV